DEIAFPPFPHLKMPAAFVALGCTPAPRGPTHIVNACVYKFFKILVRHFKVAANLIHRLLYTGMSTAVFRSQ
ncbi:jg2460, partial [Pararge aegeria aegeria]